MDPRTFLEVAGAKPEHITQARMFLVDVYSHAMVQRYWMELVGNTAGPPLQGTHYRLAPSLKVMLEFIAAH
jgi:enamine deaminase RidA (YjgF/YER057c/UK114 family)